MTPEQTKVWLEECLKSEELFEHEKVMLKVMIAALLVEPELKRISGFDSFPVAVGKDLSQDFEHTEYGGTVDGVCPFITTSKKKKLAGNGYELFMEFWRAFDYKKSRAEAAQAWLDIPDTKDKAFMEHVLYAARQTASERKPSVTPKMAQGWLSGRRWEDYDMESALPTDWNEEKWLKSLTPYLKRTRTWPEYMPGPNPWEHKNTEIPGSVYELHAPSWGWK